MKGATLCNELRLLIVDKIKTFGYCKEMCKPKRGAFAAVAHDLHLSKMTVSKIWNLYALSDSIVPCKAKPGPQRKLSNEDTLYIKQLVLLKPTIYRREIRYHLLENTKSLQKYICVSNSKNYSVMSIWCPVYMEKNVMEQ